uniref:Uncharacterized protein n=1 Tax=Rhizophora mucronata TaxID=61149 RepID=A0A2P2ND09_RHIMU
MLQIRILIPIPNSMSNAPLVLNIICLAVQFTFFGDKS